MKGLKGRKAVVVLLLFLFVGVFLFTGAGMRMRAMASVQSGLEDDISMEVTYGYQNIAKGSRYVPLLIQFTNPGKTVDGTLSVRSMEADYEIYEYQYPIVLQEGETYTKMVHIPLVSQRDQLYLTLTDENGRQIAKKRLKMDTNKENAELFVGVLSEEQDHLTYFDNVGIYYSVLKTRHIPMNTENFPDNLLEMDLLDVLLVTDFDVNTLSPVQQETLMEWVNRGGVLVLGTGNCPEKTLEILDEDYMGLVYGEVMQREVTFGAEYGKSGPADAGLTLPCVNIELKNGQVLLSSDDFPLLTMIHQEQGKIAVAAFDFVDIEEFCREQPSFIGKLFTEIYGEDGLMAIANYQDDRTSTDYWDMQSMVQSGSANKLPKVELYTAVMALYVLFVGPGLYLFLKKREWGHFYRAAVILSSLGFTGIIYMMGGSTRLYSAFFSYATIHEASRDSMTDTTYINARVPYNKSYEVEVNADYIIQPVTRDSRYYFLEQIPAFTGTEEPQVSIRYGQDHTTVAVADAVAFTPKYFKMEKSQESKGQYLEGEIVLFDGGVYGYVTNHYPFEIQNAAIVMYGSVVQLGNMQPDETRELSGEQAIRYPLSNCYVAAQFLSGYDKYNKADINDSDYLAALESSNMIRFYMQKHFNRYTQEAAVVAFYEEEEKPDFLSEQNYECFGRTMLVSPISLGEKKNGYVYRLATSKNPRVASGNYYEDSNSMYGPDPLVLEYALGNDLDIDEVVFEPLADVFLDKEKYYYLSIFSGDMYFYNYNTGNYNLIEEKERFGKKELEPYLSPENTLTVKYVQKNDGEANTWDYILPTIFVKGRER